MDPLCPQDAWPDGFPPFHPRPWLTNGHLQTIAGNFLPRPKALPAPDCEFVEISPAHGRQISTQILCECHWRPLNERSSAPTVIVLHGLEGSSRSQYVIGNATKLWRAGCNVVRMNMRNCGGTEKLTPTLYHSGMSGDVNAVMQHFVAKYSLTSVALIGYSMGGNLVLKLAGELGSSSPKYLKAVVGVSPAMDLGASADALHEPANRIYERRFLRALLKRFRRKAFLFPRAFDPSRSDAISSLREYDDKITALYSGFRNADDYYFRAAAARVLDRIVVPTLLIHACDDPFVRIIPETRASIEGNPHITLLETAHGGHCAFLATPEPANGNDGYWAEHQALRFIRQHTGKTAEAALHAMPVL
jgi:predicted alpha/beta-fold hydrolase